MTWADKVKGLSAPPITEPISKPSGDADLPTSESDARADGTNNDVDDGILFAYCIKKNCSLLSRKLSSWLIDFLLHVIKFHFNAFLSCLTFKCIRPPLESSRFDTSDGGEWETVSGKPRQAKHVKNQRTDQRSVRNGSSLSSHKDSKPKSSDLASDAPGVSSGFVNLVVDRFIGCAGSPSNSLTSPSGDKPVEFASHCRGEVEAESTSGKAAKQLMFEGDVAGNTDSALADLDAVEAEFLKAGKYLSFSYVLSWNRSGGCKTLSFSK